MPAANVTGLEGVASNITFLDQCTLEPYSLNYASLRYIPNLGANAAFGGIFVISLVAQIILWFSYRTHSYTFSMICGLILEVVGYAFRIAMRNHMFKEGPFLIVIAHYGIYNSRLSPKAYTIGFITSDFLALVLQSASGAVAETANDRATSKAWTNIMVGGLVFQVASQAVFSALAAEFFWKVKADRKHIRSTNWAYGVPEKQAGDIDGFEDFLKWFVLLCVYIA
ncbi:hypothetical protein ACEPPN_016341 [Leptodophora sp. 'Broadleaf-Isolate-01']